MENRPAFFWHWFALNALGVAILPINPDLQPNVAHQFSVAEPDLTVTLPEHQDLIRAAGMSAERIIAPDRDPPLCRAGVDRNHGGPDDPCACCSPQAQPANPSAAFLQQLLHRAGTLVHQPRGRRVDEGGAGGDPHAAPPVPHECPCLLCPRSGSAQEHARSPGQVSCGSWWATVAESGATIVHYLGVMPAILLKLPQEPAERAHQIRFGFGAGVDPRHQIAFEERFGFALIEAWAMTETGGGAVTTTAAGHRHVGERCIGYPAPAMDYRIVADDGADAPDGQPGELLVRAKGDQPRHGFFTTYLKDPEATDQAWAGGWFHTGDVVRRGADGALYFVDRKKNIVRRSGENIAVVEVEGVLQNLMMSQASRSHRGRMRSEARKCSPWSGSMRACLISERWRPRQKSWPAPVPSSSPTTRFLATSPSWSIFQPLRLRNSSGLRSGGSPSQPCKIPRRLMCGP